jgi:NADPH-dependent glutamate synthase beta subunit-like oxidoreductase
MLAMELLLAGHPEDCSTCPKYGNCELQMLIQYIGPKTGRMKLRVKGFKENGENPLLLHDMNRCVLCGRCIRACGELRGVNVLRYNKNETETYVGTLHDKLLKDANCRFCQACAEVCPTGAIRDKLASLEMKKEEYVVPCRAECPTHTDIPRYISFVKKGDYDAAAAVVREKDPFPGILGYICMHTCELQCKRKYINESTSIRELKRYAAEKDTGKYWKGKGKQLQYTGKKVCVIGAGPAGLTAAYYLRKQGHAVFVKEAMPAAGGMMRYGIPEYRLPRDLIDKEVKVIEDQGVVIELNTKVGNPVDLLKEYDAVLVAMGRMKGSRLPIEGSELPGTVLCSDFLRKASMGEDTGIGKKVLVLGGGNVAFDCARTAVRVGAEEVHLVCRKARDAMRADEEEVMLAEEEGVILHTGRTFEKVEGEDHVTGAVFMNIDSYTYDENGRPKIVKDPASAHLIEGDTVIFAVGMIPDLPEDFGLETGRARSVAVKDMEKDLNTSVEGIFAAGDCVYGTKSVIKAIASGREAASEIDKYLGGDGDISEVLAPVEEHDPCIGVYEGFAAVERNHNEMEPVENRCDNFCLVDHGICSDRIGIEAGRCLQCDLRMDISKPRLWGDYSDAGKEA